MTSQSRWIGIALSLSIVPAAHAGLPEGACVPQAISAFVPPQETLSAVHYYPWYPPESSTCPANTIWCNCFWNKKPGFPRPVEGFYNSFDADVVGRHMDLMVARGIDVVSVEWTNQPLLNQTIAETLLPAISTRNLKFVLLYDLGIIFGADLNFNTPLIRSTFLADFSTFITSTSPQYFQHPKYLKFANNRPVIYLYVSREITDSDLSNGNDVITTFSNIRQIASQNGFPDLYIVADQINYTHPTGTYDKLAWMGARAATSFHPAEPGLVANDGPVPPLRVWADRLNQAYDTARPQFPPLVDLMPGVFVQYDDTGFGPGDGEPDAVCPARNNRVTQAYHLRSTQDFTYMLNTAGMDNRFVSQLTQIDADCAVVSTSSNTDTSIVWVYSFNEWGEGAGLEAPRNPQPQLSLRVQSATGPGASRCPGQWRRRSGRRSGPPRVAKSGRHP